MIRPLPRGRNQRGEPLTISPDHESIGSEPILAMPLDTSLMGWRHTLARICRQSQERGCMEVRP